jgi:hypothetical protein
MSEKFQLSLEQEFSIRAFNEQIQGLSHQEAIEMLQDLFRLSVVKEGMYKQMLLQEIGAGLPFLPPKGE